MLADYRTDIKLDSTEFKNKLGLFMMDGRIYQVDVRKGSSQMSNKSISNWCS